MSSLSFSWLFVAFLAAMSLTQIYLAVRQIKHVARHRDQVPEQFRSKIGLTDHQRAADYTMDRTRLVFIDVVLSLAITLMFTLFGGLQFIHELTLAWLPSSPIAQALVFVAVFVLMSALLDIPMSWYRQFTIEARYGFNRMTPGLFLSDQIKGLAVGAVIGLPLLAAILWLMKSSQLWWLWAWMLWVGFSLLMMILGPMLIIPLFNKLEPLPDGSLKAKVLALMKRCEFEANGLFVMDGSKRSSHGNAFFTGMGKGRRIVLYDTIVAQLNEAEIEAVLAHELGHFKLKHIIKRVVPSLILALPVFWLIAYLTNQPWFFQGLGMTIELNQQTHYGAALVLFMIAAPVFSFFLSPLAGLLSRKHEFEADQFAAKHSSAQQLVNALVKLYQDNASTLTPDPLHSAFYDSHPPASIRIQRLVNP